MAALLWSRLSCCLLAFALLVSGAPAPQNDESQPPQLDGMTPTPTASNSACGQIDSMTRAFSEKNPGATPQVPASVANDCLQSVPNKPEPAAKMIDSLQAFVQWQSTLAYLKNPPSTYMLPGVDMVARLNDIKAKSQSGGYQSEYEFQFDIVKTFLAAHDGHFAYRPDVFKAFGFRNNLAKDIVSVSTDGKAVPQLYHFGDLQAATVNGTKTPDKMPPAIVRINGQDAAKSIEDNALEFSTFQDPDSMWNSQFRTFSSVDNTPVVAAFLGFQGNTVKLDYDDGRTKTEDSFAILRPGVNFTGVNSGEDFYQRFCNPDAANTTSRTTPIPGQNGAATPPKPPNPGPTIEGYPYPIVRDSGANTTSGYFLNGSGYEDTAVLAVSSFSPPESVDPVEYLTNFQAIVGKFLAQSNTAGKKKLVIDVTSNGGGFVVAGFELFSQLFPDVNKFQANNIRLADSVVNVARIVASIPDNFKPKTDKEKRALDALQNSAIIGNFQPNQVFTPEGRNFTGVDQIIAPISLQGDLFTAYQAEYLNQTDSSFNLTGTGNRAKPPPAVFKPEDVVLMTDGTCGSTCTIFSYLMIQRLNIKTVVVGGRPNTGSMQSIAGVEGAQIFDLADMAAVANATIELAPEKRKKDLMAGQTGVMAEGYIIKRAASPTLAGGVNGKNAFSSADSQTPLQFLMQPANCRFFYTAQMLMKPEMAWQRARDVTWRDPGMCVEGSQVTLNKTSSAVDPLFRLSIGNEGMRVSSETPAVNKAVAGGFCYAVLAVVILTSFMSLL